MMVTLPLLQRSCLSNTKNTSHIFGGKMNRTKEVRSVFGNAQRTSYEYIKFLKEKYNTNFRILVVDDKDGLHSTLVLVDKYVNFLNVQIIDKASKKC